MRVNGHRGSGRLLAMLPLIALAPLIASAPAAHVAAVRPDAGTHNAVSYSAVSYSAVSYSAMPGSTLSRVVSPQSAYTCGWGPATTSVCPQVHWANNGYSRPVVYIVDRANAAWPVAAAAATWNQAGALGVYATGSCPGYSGTHCVVAYDANFGATGWVGYTSYSWNGARNLIDGSVTIYLNDYYALNSYGRRQSACHEMGHALGLGHDSSTTSCLYADILNSGQLMYPNNYDEALLDNIYSVAH